MDRGGVGMLPICLHHEFSKFIIVFECISRAAQWSEDENININYISQMVLPESPTNGFRYSGGRGGTPGKLTVVNAWVIENARSTFKLGR